MSLFKNLFGKKDEPIKSNEDFWLWFQNNAQSLFEAVKQPKNIQKDFIDKISPKLKELNDGFFFLAGMYNDNTVELVITVDGIIKNIVFVEELVGSAPLMAGWKFTALKPSMNVKGVKIEMAGHTFDDEKISFYSIDHTDRPDEIDLRIVHQDFTEENKGVVTNGCFIFLDNYLGELNFVTTIDNLEVIYKDKAEKELVPIDKLNAFLIWRQKEFIEKYEGTRYNTENDNYAALSAKLKNGNPLMAVINTDLLEWENKASHPWVLNVKIKYQGQKNTGLPNEKTLDLLNEIENSITDELKDFEGYLNIGRQTANNTREIFFACKDFRKPSKVLHRIKLNYADKIEVNYDIYKDKYWRTFERFRPQ